MCVSVTANSILTLLSDLSTEADEIAKENASEFEFSQISAWISLVKKKAERIVQNESTESAEDIQSLVPFIKGSTEKGPRVSAVFTGNQKSHVHRKSKKCRFSTYRRSSRKTSFKSSLKPDVKGSVKNAFHHLEKDLPDPNFKTPPNVIEKNSAISVEKETKTLAVLTSKRKSSSELSLEKIKKSKVNDDGLNGPRQREDAKSDKKLIKDRAKNSSLLPVIPGIKSSVGANVSVLKENRMLRSKLEAKQEKAVENRKHILALRKQKLQENKKLREEKMERSLLQRLKLEKEKLCKNLRSGSESNKVTPKIAAGNETLGECSNSAKGFEKEPVSVKEKKLQKKENITKAGTSSILKSNQKTSVVKNPPIKHENEKIMNSTYVATDQPSSNSKAIASCSKAHATSTKTVPKTMKQLTNTSTPVQKKVSESYAMTPANSSFVSYDISEIRSDSEDEDAKANSKPIPSWATGVRLRNALLQQHHNPCDTDQLFGNFFAPPDLAAIMGVKKKHYNKRTSSAVWTSFSH